MTNKVTLPPYELLTQEKFELLCLEENQDERSHEEEQESKSSALDWLAQCTAGDWEEINNRRLSQPKGNLLSIIQSFQKKEKNIPSSPELRARDLAHNFRFNLNQDLLVYIEELIVLFQKSDEVREWKDYFFGIGKEGTPKQAYENLNYWIKRKIRRAEKKISELSKYKMRTEGY